jgi:hypothetical protein
MTIEDYREHVKQYRAWLYTGRERLRLPVTVQRLKQRALTDGSSADHRLGRLQSKPERSRQSLIV